MPKAHILVKNLEKLLNLFDENPVWNSFELGKKFGPWRSYENRLLYLHFLMQQNITFKFSGFSKNEKPIVLVGKEHLLFPERDTNGSTNHRQTQTGLQEEPRSEVLFRLVADLYSSTEFKRQRKRGKAPRPSIQRPPEPVGDVQ